VRSLEYLCSFPSSVKRSSGVSLDTNAYSRIQHPRKCTTLAQPKIHSSVSVPRRIRSRPHLVASSIPVAAVSSPSTRGLFRRDRGTDGAQGTSLQAHQQRNEPVLALPVSILPCYPLPSSGVTRKPDQQKGMCRPADESNANTRRVGGCTIDETSLRPAPCGEGASAPTRARRRGRPRLRTVKTAAGGCDGLDLWRRLLSVGERAMPMSTLLLNKWARALFYL